MHEIQFKLILAVLLLMSTDIRLYYQRNRKGFETAVIKHERREKYLIALFGLGLIPIIFYLLTSRLKPFSFSLPARVRWLGAGLIFAGNLLFIWSHRALGRNWSPLLEIRRGHTLITEGPYRFIRHPMYAAIFLIGIGVSLLSANWIVALSYMLPMTNMYLFRISDEEKMMAEQFGNEYKEYMRNTGRLIPKLRF
ncbi:protein-S-isoprenylcysteine O-methyltransferase [Methanosarcina sp.]|uniref:protein-S-isoprenylcysteine O-methyltransferase n=1 Tax=Methanosarcina sp. TaxID=2213 RepID=UPI002ABCC578|nr:protein-S-isoprenylcysteine O-methyltransferase [Methanosarcina sp.]MDY9928013.1 protein-S-isoprenylcysteine O-methyltransferase [Methanosarcina sp.]